MKLYRKLRERIGSSFGCSPQKSRTWALVICSVLAGLAAGLVWLWTVLLPLPAGWDLALLLIVGLGALAVSRYGRRQNPSALPDGSLEETSPESFDEDQPTIEINPIAGEPGKPQPPVYDELRHWKSFAKDAFRWIVVATSGLVLLIASIVEAINLPQYDGIARYVGLAAILLMLVSLFMIGRARATWRLRPITCDARDGRLLVHQTGSRRWVLFGSPPDTYPLDEILLTTPSQTFWETYFFRNSNTIVLEGEDGKSIVLRDITNVEKLIEIQKYRDELKQDQVRLLERHLEAQDETNNLLRQLIGRRNQQP